MHYSIGQNILLGTLRIRTHRVRKDSCVVNDLMYPDADLLPRDCYGGFISGSEGNEEKEPYGGERTREIDNPNPNNSTPVTVTEPRFQWVANEDSPGTLTTGWVEAYHAGGYIREIDFSLSTNEAMAEAADIVNNKFVNNLDTRFIMVEYFVYTPQYDTFTSCKMFYEVSIGGTWVANTQFRLFSVWTPQHPLQTLVDILFAGFVLYYIIKFIKEFISEWRRTGRALRYLTDLWNFLELVNLMVFIIVFAMKVVWWQESNSLDEVQLPFLNKYPGELERILWLYSMQIYFNSINTIISFLKLLKFVRLNERLNILTRTMEACQQNIIGVLVLFVWVVFGFAITGNTLFGTAEWEWRSLSASFSSLLRMLLGDFDYDALRQENRILAGAFFAAYMVLGLFLLLNFIIAIIAEGFAKVSVTQKFLPLDEQIAKTIRDTSRALAPSNVSKQIRLLMSRKGEGALLKQLLLSLQLQFKEQVDELEGLGDPDDLELHKRDLASWVPAAILEDLGQRKIDILWEDLEEEYHLQAQNDEELEKREQQDRVKQGVRAALSESLTVVEEMDESIAKLQATMHSIQTLVLARR
eukprot:NODE_289_length_2138_cov_56.836897_g283_i0.p1 GENE.NODE_289_length_2138_cov_56.836897_g283_i0~~NODE_289_length_2138_cov_56.836897_g283_i0.p1  ORF type:complete len:621 (+),score=183.94 NODE_289_length_2138_cov_56.836897_g283_i0:115-1863(+)